MRLVIVSDTHNRFNKLTIPDGDVLLHCGDFAGGGYLNELVQFAKQVEKLPHARKLLVPGNHDICLQDDWSLCVGILAEASVEVLHDSGITIDGIKFWGSGWTPRYGRWSFMLERGEEIAKKWALIPNDIDVLATHGPPMTILDKTVAHGGGKIISAGCEELHKKVMELCVPLHAFGHFHDWQDIIRNNGTQLVEHPDGRKTLFANVSSCSIGRKSDGPYNGPLVFDLDPATKKVTVISPSEQTSVLSSGGD